MYKEHPANARTSGDKELPSDLTSSFHYAIWPFLLIAQFMGVLPVSGIRIREKDVTRVQFKWVYVGVPVTMVLIASVAIDLILSLNIVFERGMKTYTAGPVMLSLISLLALITFLLLARQWPDLIKQFTDTEKIFLEKSYETKESKEICFRLRLYGGVLLFGATVQHGLYINTAIYDNKYQINKCNLTTDFWENLFIRERLQYFTIFNFHIWMAPLLEWLTISMTFTWHFMDIFLMLVTSSLALRFGQVSKRIRRFTSVPMTDEFWFRARKDFICLMDLMQAVDNRLSNLVVLSCAHNLFFICFNVFQSFQQRSNFFEAIYFWYSLSFVLTRILTSMLSAASITDTANDSLTAFYDIPLDFWGVELTRFYESVASDLIAISGKGFYFITRRLIFARMPNMFWKDVRPDFLAVKNLVQVLNSNLEGLTLASCGYSMYFICLQLFNSFKKSGNLISTIFFWYSLMFIIGRTLFKLFAAASVNDMCNKILSALRNVPSSSWGIEVQRLSEQLALDITAFSGCGYFFLTRKLIFAMAATIVTYELVMTDVVQEINHEDKDLCSNFI